MESCPVFVVGASRSGTTLLRSCLNQHPLVHLVGETHYFDDLRPRCPDAIDAALTPEQQRMAEDYFLALAHRPYGHNGDAAQSRLSREGLRARAGEIGQGLDAYFEAFCRIAAERVGKNRWGEKTPRHAFRIPDILQRYPDAQIVCMVRDPRAVAASYRDWRHQGGFDLEEDPDHRAALALEEERARQSYDPRLATLLWRGTVQAALKARQQFGDSHVRVQRYEELVRDPERTLRSLTEWLGLEFVWEMLDVPIHNSSFSRFNRHGGISTAPLERWRERLGDREVASIQVIAGSVMRAQGYERVRVRHSPLLVVASLATLPAAVTKAASVNRERMGPMVSYVWRRLRVAFSSV